MKLSKMSAHERMRLLEDEESYPLRVRFLGKVGLLSREEVAFLVNNGVDLELDDRQVREQLGEPGGLAAPVAEEAPRPEGPYGVETSAETSRTVPAEVSAPSTESSREDARTGCVVAGAAALLTVLRLIRRLLRL